MADIAISALPAAGSAAGVNLTVIVQGGVTKQSTVTQFLDALSGSPSAGSIATSDLVGVNIGGVTKTVTVAILGAALPLANGSNPGLLSSALYSLLNGAVAVTATPNTLMKRNGGGGTTATEYYATDGTTSCDILSSNPGTGSEANITANHPGGNQMKMHASFISAYWACYNASVATCFCDGPTGLISSYGTKCRTGTSGAWQSSDAFNVSWDGTYGHLWHNTTDLGRFTLF